MLSNTFSDGPFSLAILGAISASAGVPLIYLHSPFEKEATVTLAANLEAARTAHLTALDRHDVVVKAAMQREKAAVVKRLGLGLVIAAATGQRR